MESNEIITKSDLGLAIKEIKSFIKQILEDRSGVEKKWLRNKEVKKILGLSDSGLQNLRINGSLPYSRIGGTIYYDPMDIKGILEKNKVG